MLLHTVAPLSLLLFVFSALPAHACRCWTGNSETTDVERLRVAQQAVEQSSLAVIGTITAGPFQADLGIQVDGQETVYTSGYPATITVERVLTGSAGDIVRLPGVAGNSIYDGTLESSLLGTCPCTWRDGERSVWLMLSDADGDLVLASSCAHSLVRKWLYPEFSSE